jgi:hypothetical protein
MNFPRWFDFSLIGAIIGLAAAFGSASWGIAAISIPGGALSGAAIGILTKRRGRRG